MRKMPSFSFRSFLSASVFEDITAQLCFTFLNGNTRISIPKLPGFHNKYHLPLPPSLPYPFEGDKVAARPPLIRGWQKSASAIGAGVGRESFAANRAAAAFGDRMNG